jgi:hypothetical protein
VNHPHAATRMGIDRGTQMLIPIGLDGQRSAIREFEARDIGRETGRVRADLAGLGAVAVAAFVTRPGANRLEFDRELAGNEGSDEVAQPMAEPLSKCERSNATKAPPASTA